MMKVFISWSGERSGRLAAALQRWLPRVNVVNLAEPVFADSAHSTLLQLVDLVSYLMLQLERAELEPVAPASSYRDAMLVRARGLRADLLHSWKGRMRFG